MQAGLLDLHIARLEDIVTLRVRLHEKLWNNENNFPLLHFLLMLAYRVRHGTASTDNFCETKTKTLKLPVSVAVYILTFLGNKQDGEQEENSLHIVSDEAYAQVVYLGDALNQAETQWARIGATVQHTKISHFL